MATHDTARYRYRRELMRVTAWRELVEGIEAAALERAGSSRDDVAHYFTGGTIDYWDNYFHGRPVTAPYGGSTYWVESRRFSDDTARAYYVKSFDGEQVETVTEWPGHETLEGAMGALYFVAGVAR